MTTGTQPPTLTDNLKKFSTDGLKKMQKAVYDALQHEDALPPGQPKPYGVRDFPDWRTWSDALEAELTVRNVPFSKVPW